MALCYFYELSFLTTSVFLAYISGANMVVICVGFISDITNVDSVIVWVAPFAIVAAW